MLGHTTVFSGELFGNLKSKTVKMEPVRTRTDSSRKASVCRHSGKVDY